MNRIHALAVAGALAVAAVYAAPQSASAQEPSAPTASAPPRDDADRTEQRRAPRRRSDVITRRELGESGTTNLLSAVERLRPQWLRSRGFTNLRWSGAQIVVYQGTTPLGGLEALRGIAPEFAEELRFLDGSQASNTLPGLGSRVVAGAIVIVRPGTTRP